MNDTRPSLSLVIPLHNEEPNVLPLLARVHEALADYGGPWELICVDDGSRDATAARVAEGGAQFGAHVQLVRFLRNHGQTAAMQAGIDAARGELIATLDGDLQNDPFDVPRMVDELQARNLDLLAGRRANRQDAWLSRKLPSRIANRLIARVTGVRLRDYGCSLKLFRAAVIKQVRLYGEMHRLIPLWAAMVTAPERIGETDVIHHPRLHGRSNYGLSRTFRLLLDLITAFFFLRFQGRPGHFFGAIGLTLGALGAGLMSYLAVVKFVLGEDIGTRPLLLIAVLLLVFAMQFVLTGVLAEMLARIFHQGAARSPADAPISNADSGWCLPRADTEAGAGPAHGERRGG